MRNWNYNNAIKNEDGSKKSDNWMIYPRVYEVNDICFKAHWGSGSHLSIERTIEAIKGLGYRWDKMEKDARELFYRWEVCAGRTKKPKKTIAYKHIDSFRPKERYQMDTVYLSDYLVSDKRYLFTMVDHFSKFGWAVVIYNKKSETIIKAFKSCLVSHF